MSPRLEADGKASFTSDIDNGGVFPPHQKFIPLKQPMHAWKRSGADEAMAASLLNPVAAESTVCAVNTISDVFHKGCTYSTETHSA